ncbi:competence protein CoiA [Pontibacillus salicampi]|uniref:Competence protein CoiA n=1 Tax=Pontibacillus salicampi TaxID=1449801 RepID=A0ABV6LQT5_9BACI
MLKALDEQGEAITLFQLPRRSIDLLRSTLFFCPVCEQPLVIKAGSTMVPHFAHRRGAFCTESLGGEGPYHEQGKIQLYQWLKKQGYSVELEVYLPQLQQRTDLLLTLNGRRIAIEYQCCRISPEIMLARTKGYKNAGITPLWILGGNRLKPKGENAISLSSFENLFFHQFQSSDSPAVFFYCSQQQTFATFQHPYYYGKQKAVGSLRYFPMKHCSLPQLLQSVQPPSSPFLHSFWLRQKKQFRGKPHTIFKRSPSYSFYQFLYLRGYHASFLPSLVYVPVYGLLDGNEAPYSWQGKWIVETVIPMSIMGTITIESHTISTSPLLMEEGRRSNIAQYAHVLTKLGVLRKVSHNVFQKCKDISIPKTIEEGLKEDEIVLQKLFREQ